MSTVTAGLLFILEAYAVCWAAGTLYDWIMK